MAAEEAGFDSIWVMDHFFQLDPMLGKAQDPMLEAYTTLGFIAASTKTVKLGTLVSGVIYREPALLIKAVTTLDVLSGGRAYFGIGAGWYEQEAIALGFLNPLTSKRFDRLEEALQITHKMFNDDTSSYDSHFYKLKKPMNHPLPLTQPHPPILIGGGGEQRTLKLVAQYGDACNVFGVGSVTNAEHKFNVLKKHCKDLGRNYDEIEKTVSIGRSIEMVVHDAEDTISFAKALHDIDATHIMISIGNGSLKPFANLKQILTEIRAI